MKVNNSNCEEKNYNWNCDKTLKYNFKPTQKIIKSNCDITQELKLWRNSKTQIVTKNLKTQSVSISKKSFWQNKN